MDENVTISFPIGGCGRHRKSEGGGKTHWAIAIVFLWFLKGHFQRVEKRMLAVGRLQGLRGLPVKT